MPGKLQVVERLANLARASPHQMLRSGSSKLGEAEGMRGDDLLQDSTFSYLSWKLRCPKAIR
jgi:hypothetical protein